MILIILGILDIMIGVVLWLASGTPFTGAGWAITLGIIWLIKGFWSMVAGAAAGFFFDFLGIFDLLAGIFLILVYFGMVWPLFIYLGVIMIVKGLYSFAVDFIKSFVA